MRNLSPKERLEILYLEVNESRVCSKRPLCVEENKYRNEIILTNAIY